MFDEVFMSVFQLLREEIPLLSRTQHTISPSQLLVLGKDCQYLESYASEVLSSTKRTSSLEKKNPSKIKT